jgi:hypothetical protein
MKFFWGHRPLTDRLVSLLAEVARRGQLAGFPACLLIGIPRRLECDDVVL